jgi:hemerythrin-like domain-containing protein
VLANLNICIRKAVSYTFCGELNSIRRFERIFFSIRLNATNDLKRDHQIVRRVGTITRKCSDILYSNKSMPLIDIEIISVVIQEFVDKFHHGKEEKAYFPQTKDKDDYAEDIRKFLIEHELGRRIANMLLQSIMDWKSGIDSREPVARFLKAYSIFIRDHTEKEDKFFDLIEERVSLSEGEHTILKEHFERCRMEVGGRARTDQMVKLIEYLEEREWMKKLL